MEITAQLVKQLRDKTSAGMMDCKRALVENDGDMAAAEEYLRKKGLMDAAKKSSRTAADGLVAVAVSDDKKTAAMVELNSETDFVARNEKFQELAAKMAQVALKTENVLEEKLPDGKSVKEEIDHLISLVGENMSFRRAKRLEVSHGIVSTYVHSAIKPGMGKIGVLVAFEVKNGECCPNKLDEFGKKLAMHIAAANPTYMCSKCVPQEIIEKEKEIVLAQAKEIGKPEEIAHRMAEGRVKKFFEECALLEQIFVIDGKTKIHDLIDAFDKENGCNLRIAAFEKFVLGEGIEKAETNFAEEVASFVK